MSDLNTSDSFVILSKSNNCLENIEPKWSVTSPLNIITDLSDLNVSSEQDDKSYLLEGKLASASSKGFSKPQFFNLEDTETYSNSSEKFNSYDELLDSNDQNKTSPVKLDYNSSSKLAKELSTNQQSSLPNSSQSLPNQNNQADIVKSSFNSCPLVGNYNFSLLGESFEGLENVDLKSISSLTDSSLIQIQKQMMQLREDNCKLISVLQVNNQVMKKNLKIAQGLKDKLDLAKKSYIQLKESSEDTISKLKTENVQLQEKVSQLEAEESIKYGKLSLNQELNLQDQCAQVIEKEQKIEALTKELKDLKVKYDHNSDNSELAAALKDQCETYFKKYKVEENLKTKLMKENLALKDLIKHLREEKFCLEEQLDKGEPAIDLKPANNQEKNEENSGSKRSGRRHRHAHKLKMLQIPVLNPGIILQGFKQHRT